MIIDLNGVNKSYRTRLGMTPILRDVSLRVNQGEHVGILGQNGSGKSTLIRILSGSERPTSGTVYRGMSVSWPLAFGGAFLGALTGLDNLRFVCRLYGVDPKDKLEFVQDFTELGKYLREPVKSYSSGMRARLAFAVSMAIDFDCYLIDEIVAVGDDRFQRKCQVELFEKRGDKALLIVSHSPEFIRDHCHKASVLVAGQLTNFDNVDAAYSFYSSHELAMQPHMQETQEPLVPVFLPPEPVETVLTGYREARDGKEFGAFLESLEFERVPVFDSCDVVGRLAGAGDTTAAIAAASWLTERRPDEPLFWVTLGDLHCKLRHHLPGLGAYNAALQLDPSSYWANRNLATELFNVGRYDDAIPIYDRAIAVAPSTAAATELQLRRLDCIVLTDRLTLENRSQFGTPRSSFELIDQAGVVLSNIPFARLAIGGLASPGTDISKLTCIFRSSKTEWRATPTFARNSIRRLASCSDVEAFAFVYYGLVEDHDEIAYEVSEGDELHLSGLASMSKIDAWDGAERLPSVEAARSAIREHRAAAAMLMYGVSAQAGDKFDIVPFAESLIAVGHYDESEYRLQHWLAGSDPRDPCRSNVIDLLCQELARARLPDWRQQINALLARESKSGASASVLANSGHARVADGDIPGAIIDYEKASRLASGNEIIHFSRGIHTARLAPDVPRLAVDDLPARQGDAPEFVHLFACDANYFCLFGPALVASSRRKTCGTNVAIHAHVVDPDLESLALAGHLTKEFGLVLTTETSPQSIIDEKAKRAYFTCARFLVAPWLLRHYDCPLLITEADCLLNWDWVDLKSFIVDSDVGYMRSSLWNWVPWTKIPAGLVLLTPSREGMAHAEFIARFIRHAFETGGAGTTDLWTVDQVALWLAHVTGNQERHIHLPMYSVLTLATGDKSNLVMS